MCENSDVVLQNAMWISMPDPAPATGADKKIRSWDMPVDRAQQVAAVPYGTGLPVFMKRFGADGRRIVNATVYITALGIFDLYMNGKRVGTVSGEQTVYDELKPGWSDYNKRVLYYTYDLKPYLSEGVNRVAAVLAPGWWQGRISFNTYGERDLALLAAVSCEYEDGSRETVVTDSTWSCTWGGPIRSADIWDGEVYDASYAPYASYSLERAEDETAWQTPQIFTYSGAVTRQIGPTVQVRRELPMRPVMTTVYEGVRADGTDFGSVIVREQQAGAQACELRKGQTLIYDMGQNMVGWAHFTVRGARHTTVTIRYAEMLNDTGLRSRGNDGPMGSVYTANYRSAKAKGYYALAGTGAEEYRPTFTFYGFRYVELTADADVEILSFCADVVGSATRETGWIETSNADVNRLIRNIFWGQRGNYLSVPTDCPQRDERLGWTGDTQIFAGTASYNADVCGFFHKWLQDARDGQNENGAYPDVIPRSNAVGEGNGAWGDAGIIVPYVMYRMYGDRSILEESYDSMEKYMTYLTQYGYNGPNTAYGDWLAYEPTDSRYVSVAYYAYDALLMRFMSQALGKEDRAAYYAGLYEEIRTYFRELYLDANGKLTQQSQTAYLLALKLHLLPDSYEAEAKEALLCKIRDNGYRLSTGFVGSGILNQTLSEIGATNMAYSLLLQTENPSWLYSVYQGATTIWERWNSYTLETGFGEVAMNSFNHYAYGSVGEWMYKYMCGIEADDREPGFAHIILQPMPDTRTDAEMPAGQTRITWARARYDSVAGRIESGWKMEAGTFVYEATVPEGAYATLYLPILNGQAETVTVNGVDHPIGAYATENGKLVMRLESGSYTFRMAGKGE